MHTNHLKNGKGGFFKESTCFNGDVWMEISRGSGNFDDCSFVTALSKFPILIGPFYSNTGFLFYVQGQSVSLDEYLKRDDLEGPEKIIKSAFLNLVVLKRLDNIDVLNELSKSQVEQLFNELRDRLKIPFNSLKIQSWREKLPNYKQMSQSDYYRYCADGIDIRDALLEQSKGGQLSANTEHFSNQVANVINYV